MPGEGVLVALVRVVDELDVAFRPVRLRGAVGMEGVVGTLGGPTGVFGNELEVVRGVRKQPFESLEDPSRAGRCAGVAFSSIGMVSRSRCRCRIRSGRWSARARR